MALGNWVQETTVTTGTGTMTLVAVSDQAEFIDAVAEGTVVDYTILDDNGNKEVGRGTTGASKTLARTTVITTLVSGTYDDTSPTAITLSGSATVILSIAAENVVDKYDTQFVNMMYRDTASVLGTATNGHINLGSGTSITGTAAQAYDYCTVGGGLNNSATQKAATVCGGENSTASGISSLVCGGKSNTASANYSTICGGISNTAISTYSFVGGGGDNDATGSYSFIGGGSSNTASGLRSACLGGAGNTAGQGQDVALVGAVATRASFDVMIGGTDSNTSSNANNTIRLQGTGGNIKIDGAVTSPEADYAEMFEWFDQNPEDIDRVGYFVSLYKGKIVRGAGRSDKSGVSNYLASVFTNESSATSTPMIGVISGNPSVIGDGAPNHWNGRHIKDRFGRKDYEEYDYYEIEDSNGFVESLYVDRKNGQKYKEYPQYTHKGISSNSDIPITPGKIVQFPKVSAEYNVNTSYIPRIERQEWDAVGMLGKLVVHSAEPITSDWVSPTGDGRAVNASEGVGYQVLEVIDNFTVRILFK